MRAGATLRGVRLRLALALGLVVAATLAVVYLIVVPSLESELITAKLDQLEVDANTVARGSRDEVGNEQPYVEAAASVVQARVVFYSVLEDLLLIQGDSNLTSSVDVERDPTALRAAETGELQRDTVERGGRLVAEVAIPVPEANAVILLRSPLTDPLATLHFIERQLLIAGAIGLLFALLVGYALAAMHSRRIRRLERAADRIAGGRFDEPVVDRGRDELGELARGVRADARPAREARPRAQRVHRQRLARAAHAALLARGLPRADGRRGARRRDEARVPRDDAGAGRPPGQACHRPARPLAARRRPDAGGARAG